MDSRSIILEKIRKNKPQENKSNIYLDPVILDYDTEENIALFKERLKQVGGELIEIETENELQTVLAEKFPGILDAGNEKIQLEYNADCTRDKLYSIEILLLTSPLGVAENGAIWLEEKILPNRLLPFATQQLVICINKKNIVRTMPDAYANLSLQDTGFGVFISGPSKTADIEQSLVYGAHGAKELSVILVG